MCHFPFWRCRNLRFSTPFLPFPYTWSTFPYSIISPIDKLSGGCQNCMPCVPRKGDIMDTIRAGTGCLSITIEIHFFPAYTAVLEGIAVFFCSTQYSFYPYEIPTKYENYPAVPGSFQVRLFLCHFLPCGVASIRCRSPPCGILEPIQFQNFGGKPWKKEIFIYT